MQLHRTLFLCAARSVYLCYCTVVGTRTEAARTLGEERVELPWAFAYARGRVAAISR